MVDTFIWNKTLHVLCLDHIHIWILEKEYSCKRNSNQLRFKKKKDLTQTTVTFLCSMSSLLFWSTLKRLDILFQQRRIKSGKHRWTDSGHGLWMWTNVDWYHIYLIAKWVFINLLNDKSHWMTWPLLNMKAICAHWALYLILGRDCGNSVIALVGSPLVDHCTCTKFSYYCSYVYLGLMADTI